jgi:hypothetical protein
MEKDKFGTNWLLLFMADETIKTRKSLWMTDVQTEIRITDVHDMKHAYYLPS